MPAIVSANITKFDKERQGQQPRSLLGLAEEAARPILERHREVFEGRGSMARVRIVVANSYAAEFNGVSGSHLQIASSLGLGHIPSFRADNISGSGGAALHQADLLIRSGDADIVLVVGAEKMTHMPTKEITRAISTLLLDEERATGLTLPSLAGLMATACMSEYGITERDLASVAVANRMNGSLNPNSYHYGRGTVTHEQVLESKVITSPLTLFQFCPNADGGAAILVTANDITDNFTDNPVFIRGMGTGADSAIISTRRDFTSMPAVERAAAQAYGRARIIPSGIDVFEAHDMATPLQPVQMIAAGIMNSKEAWSAAAEGRTLFSGDMPVNTSGGLISCGHPIAVSGMKQIIELFHQLRGEAGQRQIAGAYTGAFVSLGGFANSAVMGVLSRDGNPRERLYPRAFEESFGYSPNGSSNGNVNGLHANVRKAAGRVLTTTVLYATAEGSPDVVRLVVAQLHSGSKVIAMGTPEHEVKPGDDVLIGKTKEGIPALLRR